MESIRQVLSGSGVMVITPPARVKLLNYSSQVQQIQVSEQDAGRRLDVVLSRLLGVSRSRATAHCRKGLVLRASSGKPAKPSTPVTVGERFTFPPLEESPRGTKALSESIPLDIVFEDESMLVVNKPAGMVVHPAPGHYSGALVNAL